MKMKKLENKEEATEVIAHDVAPLTVDTDAGKFSRLGWLIVLLGVGGFVLWALFAPLDKGVPLQGTVAKESNRKSVQHLTGGTVEEILVKDGDVVKAGQVLVRMNGVAARSQAEVTRGQWISARATEARLLAELSGRSSVIFPQALMQLKNDPRAIAAMALQEQLFTSRQSAMRSDLEATDSSIAGMKAQIEGMKEAREGNKAQMVIIKEQLENLRGLAKDGYVARARMLDVERNYIQLSSAVAETSGNLARNQNQVVELTLRRGQRVQEYQRDVRATLADVQRDAEALENRLKQLDYDLANIEIKAPAAGIVTNLAIFTQGGVVGAGFKLMDIVPTADGLVVEGQLMVNLVDKVRPGLPVELNFSAFNANKTPHIPGEVIQVAADRSIEDRTGMPYYKVRVKVTAAGAKIIAAKKLDIQPGMPVDLFVKTGERTMMNYLFKPLVDRGHSALSED
jgi:membrane fusion protein, protease secretion system